MKILFSLLFFVTLQTAFSQTWEKIKIDDKVSITAPGQSKMTIDGDVIRIWVTSSIGELTIERGNLQESMKSGSPGWVRGFSHGFMFFMTRMDEVEIVDAKDEIINNVEARNVLVQARTGQFAQLYIFAVNHKIYIIKFKDNTTSSPEQRQKIFSSIEISN